MAVSTIAHKPQITKEQLEEIFRQHFAGKYKVEDFKGFNRDFQVVKNAFVGISVKLEQAATETKIVYTGFVPKLWARMFLGVLLGFLLWNGLTNEVKQFIETAPELK